MDINKKINLISRLTEEIITLEDVEFLLKSGKPLKHYIGFEISGKIHLGTGLICMQKVKDFADAGIKVHIFLADYHTWINDKLGGDLEIIKKTAVGYFKEGLSIAYKCLGGNPRDLNFILGSEFYHHNDLYWQTMIEIAKKTSLNRIKRSVTIMGRKESEDIEFGKLFYPVMQTADTFAGGFHFAQAGMDQRKVHVIARDAAKQLKFSPLKIGEEIVKPVAVHTHLLLSLDKPSIWPIPRESVSNQRESALIESMKMSKSKPDNAIFIHDSVDEIKRKIKKAFCPEGEIEFNPIIDWVEFLIFSREEKIVIKRKPEHGGNLEIYSIDELKKIFKNKELHPNDLKNFVADYLIKLLKPAREYFEKNEPKKMLLELEELIKK